MQTVRTYEKEGNLFTFSFDGTVDDNMLVNVKCKEIGFWEIFEWKFTKETFTQFVEDVLANCII